MAVVERPFAGLDCFIDLLKKRKNGKFCLLFKKNKKNNREKGKRGESGNDEFVLSWKTKLNGFPMDLGLNVIKRK